MRLTLQIKLGWVPSFTSTHPVHSWTATRYQFVLRRVNPAFHTTEHRQRRCIRSTAKQLCHSSSCGRCSFVQQRQRFHTYDSSVLNVVRFVHQYAPAHLRDNGASGTVLFLLVCHLCQHPTPARSSCLPSGGHCCQEVD